ncbi:hypothetical protein BDZ89DRAFT_382885 [Hymenopellis radicata]|nr:hypothetical protein BDZ89DRAFT_382885 [Hymenopellis radicata]
MAAESTLRPVKPDMKEVLKTLKFKKTTLPDNCDVGTSTPSNNHAVKNDAIPVDSAIFPPTVMVPAAPSVSSEKSPRKLQEDDADQSPRKRRKVESTPQTPATRKYKRLPKEGWFLLDSEIPPSSLVWEPRRTPRQWTVVTNSMLPFLVLRQQ